MNTDLQDIIASSSVKAFNAGYAAGILEGQSRALEAAKFVQFDCHDVDVIALSDLEEELRIRASSYHRDRQVTSSEADLQGKS
jgi:hypothetical protein